MWIKQFFCKHESLAFEGVTNWQVIEHNDNEKKEIRYEEYHCLMCKKRIKKPEIKLNGKVMQRK